MDEYLVDLNATQAAIRAGYSPKTATVTASENLTKPNIQAAIQAAKDERSAKTKIDSTYVLTRLSEIDQMDAKDIFEDDGSLKHIKDWPKIWRQFLSGFDVKEIWDGYGDDRKVSGMLKKVKWPDKVKNLELIGKHVSVGAWKETVELTGVLTLAEALRQVDRK